MENHFFVCLFCLGGCFLFIVSALLTRKLQKNPPCKKSFPCLKLKVGCMTTVLLLSEGLGVPHKRFFILFSELPQKRKVWPEWKLLPGCRLWCVMDRSLNARFFSSEVSFRCLPVSPRRLTAQVAKQAFYSRDSCLSRHSRGASVALCAVSSEAKRACVRKHTGCTGADAATQQ